MGEDVRDVVIIGSGPAGYTAAIYAARANLRPRVFEGSVSSGGALMNTTDVENFPGFADAVMGPDLMASMRAQAGRFGAELVRDDVTAVDLGGPVKIIEDSEGGCTRARAVILAMGSSYRRLGIPGEDRLSGHGVSWCATCDGFFFKDHHIAVVGGGDSALEEATFLAKFGSRVTVIHRRDTLRASQIMADRARANERIEFRWSTVVTDLVGSDRLEGVMLEDLRSGERYRLDASALFVAVGHDPRSELVRDQIEVDQEGYVAVRERTTQTSVEGVFAAGDLVDHRYRQAVTAAGSGCAAAIDAERYLAGAVVGVSAASIGARAGIH